MPSEPVKSQIRMPYADLPCGNFFVLAELPNYMEFFKCQPWASVSADLEKLIQFKPDVEVIVTNRSGKLHGETASVE